MPLSFISDYTGNKFDGEDLAITNSVIYKAITEEQLGVLEYYDYDGDLDCIKNEGYVIVGDSKNNMKTFRFEVGDKIRVAVKTGQYRKIDSNVGGRALLESQLKYFKFEYREYTVGAVLHNIPCTNTPIYIPAAEYESATGLTPDAKTFLIYADDGLSVDEMKTLYENVREWAHRSGDILVTDNDIALNRSVSQDRHYDELFIVIALMILVISPLVWFFSQALYYAKREKEFNILQALGAVGKEIKTIYIEGGLTMAALSLVTSVALSYLGSFLVYLFFNVAIPAMQGEVIRYSFYMPWYAIVTSIVVSVVCGFLSTYLPFLSYYRHRRSLQNGGAGEEYGADE